MLFSSLRPTHGRHAAASGLRVRARAWVGALLALFLLSCLAPAISRTLDHGKPLAERGWVEVCSSHGLSWVRADQGPADRSAAADALQHLDSCAYCALATDRGTPPPSFEGWGLIPSVPPACLAWAGHPVPTAAAHNPLARGPPVSS